MSGPLAGKVALVTGASRGIGRGVALVLAEQGATVYVTGRTVRDGDHALPGTVGATAAECDARGGRGVAVPCDHADDAAVAAVFDRIRDETGRLDILVNNATVLSEGLLDGKQFWEKPLTDLEQWDVGMRSNFVASWHAAKIMVPQKSGLIVHVSGFTAVTYTYGVIFGTTKSAVDRMARDMAIELEPHNVACLAIWQGLTLTERAQDNLAKVGDRMTKSITNMTGSTVEHPGRVVAALAADPEIMKRSGGEFITTELAMEYGITDVDGRTIPSARATRGSPIWKPIAEVDYRGK